MAGSWVTRQLERAHPLVFSAYCITAAFSTYFCMYAFRKPFTAATFEGSEWWGIGYKTLLIAAQLSGYTVSKFIGIKVISEMSSQRRGVSILLLIGTAHVSLLLFALVPPPYNLIFLFCNGLPLGMVFGLVLSYLEGRRLTEALAAGLCASFIVSSGVVKSIGRYLVVSAGVSEYWMPFLTGLIFLAPTLFFTWMLSQVPAPSARDVSHRSARTPMTAAERRKLFATISTGLTALVITYVILTIMRSVRDDFAVEIWQQLGQREQPAIFAQSELAVMLGVVVVSGLAVLIHDNRTALRMALLLIMGGFGVVIFSVIGYRNQWLGSFAFMVISGLGMYVPYVTFHTTVFERIIAVFRQKSNIGYLMYLADATGYLGYVAVMIGKNVGWRTSDYLAFFLHASLLLSVVSLLLMLGCILYFEARINRLSALTPAPQAGS